MPIMIHITPATNGHPVRENKSIISMNMLNNLHGVPCPSGSTGMEFNPYTCKATFANIGPMTRGNNIILIMSPHSQLFFKLE